MYYSANLRFIYEILIWLSVYQFSTFMGNYPWVSFVRSFLDRPILRPIFSFTTVVILSRRRMSAVVLRNNQVLFSKFKFNLHKTRNLTCHGIRTNKLLPPQNVQVKIESSLMKQQHFLLSPSAIGHFAKINRPGK